MNLPGKRLLLGTAIAAAALGAGGVAYAAGNDPAPDQGYVVVEEDPGTPSSEPSTTPGDGSSVAPQGRGTHDGKDCPDKAGGQQGSSEGAQPSQPTQPNQQPEQSQADPQSNA